MLTEEEAREDEDVVTIMREEDSLSAIGVSVPISLESARLVAMPVLAHVRQQLNLYYICVRSNKSTHSSFRQLLSY